MTFKSTDLPNQERKWLVELTESEIVVVYAAVCSKASEVKGLSNPQVELLCLALQYTQDQEQITRLMNAAFSGIPKELYAFALNFNLARVGLKLNVETHKTVEEFLDRISKAGL